MHSPWPRLWEMAGDRSWIEVSSRGKQPVSRPRGSWSLRTKVYVSRDLCPRWLDQSGGPSGFSDWAVSRNERGGTCMASTMSQTLVLGGNEIGRNGRNTCPSNVSSIRVSMAITCSATTVGPEIVCTLPIDFWELATRRLISTVVPIELPNLAAKSLISNQPGNLSAPPFWSMVLLTFSSSALAHRPATQRQPPDFRPPQRQAHPHQHANDNRRNE